MVRAGKPKRLVIERALTDSLLARALEKHLPIREVRERIGPSDYPDFGPDDLVLARHYGSFIKPCPGTRGYLCCGLQIIHFGLGCHLGCTYCILQSYLNTQALVLFGNVEDGLARLQDLLARNKPPFRRYCTGEFTDSLLLEDLTGLGARLVELFAGQSQAVLELKTKTDQVQTLLGLNHGGRTIISFSVNAPAVAAGEESGAAPLKKRLAAAARAVEHGYRVGFHFDPLIRHPGWPEGYRRTVADIFQYVPAEAIAWISLGAFRYLPGLKAVVAGRHPKSRIMDEEFVLAADGKMRYLRPLRVEIYRSLLTFIREFWPEACVYLCMESPRVWREVFGFDPGPRSLIEMLDQRV